VFGAYFFTLTLILSHQGRGKKEGTFPSRRRGKQERAPSLRERKVGGSFQLNGEGSYSEGEFLGDWWTE